MAIHRQALRFGPSQVDDAVGSESLPLFLEVAASIDSKLSDWARTWIHDLLAGLLLLLVALISDWKLTLECLFPAVAGCLGHPAGSRASPGAKKPRAGAVRSESAVLAEGLQNPRLVRGYGMENFEQNRFDNCLERYNSHLLHADRGESWILWLTRLLAVLLPDRGAVPDRFEGAVDSGSLAARSRSDRLPVAVRLDRGGVVGAACGLGAASDLVRGRPHIPRPRIRFRKSDRRSSQVLEPVSKSIEFESVTYRTQGRTVLDGFNLKLAAGTRTALVSNSLEEVRGRSPTSAAFGLSSPSSGRFLLDGQDTAWGTLESSRAEAIFVGGADPLPPPGRFSKPHLRSARLLRADAIEAAKLVHAHKFISALPNRYETMLGEHGETLEPGDAFRLSLAARSAISRVVNHRRTDRSARCRRQGADRRRLPADLQRPHGPVSAAADVDVAVLPAGGLRAGRKSRRHRPAGRTRQGTRWLSPLGVRELQRPQPKNHAGRRVAQKGVWRKPSWQKTMTALAARHGSRTHSAPTTRPCCWCPDASWI